MTLKINRTTQPTEAPAQPAFRKFTDAVDRGVRYLIACGEVDSQFDLINPEVGGPLPGTINSADIRAATDWLIHQRTKALAARSAPNYVEERRAAGFSDPAAGEDTTGAEQ